MKKEIVINDFWYNYFVNIANVRKGQKMQTNIRVKFDVTQGHRGPEAENVSLV